MHMNLYEIEKHNKNEYDGLREYCLREQVNEENARTLADGAVNRKPQNTKLYNL